MALNPISAFQFPYYYEYIYIYIYLINDHEFNQESWIWHIWKLIVKNGIRAISSPWLLNNYISINHYHSLLKFHIFFYLSLISFFSIILLLFIKIFIDFMRNILLIKWIPVKKISFHCLCNNTKLHQTNHSFLVDNG